VSPGVVSRQYSLYRLAEVGRCSPCLGFLISRGFRNAQPTAVANPSSFPAWLVMIFSVLVMQCNLRAGAIIASATAVPGHLMTTGVSANSWHSKDYRASGIQ